MSMSVMSVSDYVLNIFAASKNMDSNKLKEKKATDAQDNEMSVGSSCNSEEARKNIDSNDKIATDLQDNEMSVSSSYNSEEGEVLEYEENSCQSLYSFNLKEYSELSHLLSIIPAKAQRGFDTYELSFTCLDASPDFIAVGTNIGTLYLYDRRDGTIERFRYENYIGSVTAVTSLTQENYLLAFGFDNGTMVAANISLNSNADSKMINRINVLEEHHATITCLEWGTDFPELFSGDKNGLVVQTVFDFAQNSKNSSPMFGEPVEIIQISYMSRMLAISTLKRTIICQILEGSGMRCHRVQVGQQDRKRSGHFGAVFDPKTRNFQLPILYTSRPGTRLWKSDSRGKVIETMLLNESLERLPSHTIVFLSNVNPNLGVHKVSPKIKPQLEKLKMFQDLFVFSWNEDGVFIIDPDMRIMVASAHGLQRVVDVSVCREEIFILQGERCIRRIATSPEDALFPGRTIKAPLQDLFPLSNLLSPFHDLSSSFKSSPILSPAGREENQTDLNIPVLGWFKNKLKKSDNNKVDNQASTAMELPPIVNLNIGGPVEIGAEASEANEPDVVVSASVKIRSVSQAEVDEDLIFQPKRKKRPKAKLKKGSITDSENSEVSIQTGITEVSLNKETTVPTEELKTEAHLPVQSIPISRSPDTIDGQISADATPDQHSPNQAQFAETEDDRLTKILTMYSQSQVSKSSFEISCESEFNQVGPSSSPIEEVEMASNRNEPKSLDAPPIESEENYVGRPVEELCNNNNDPDIYRLVWQVSSVSSCEPPTPDYDIYSQNKYKGVADNPTATRPNEPTNIFFHSTEEDSTDSRCLSHSNLESEWIRHSTPGSIVSLSASQVVLYATNNKDELHYTLLKGLVLVWKNMHVQAHFVSVSPTGNFMAIIYKGTLKTAPLKPNGIPLFHFRYTEKNVMCAAADDDRIWYINGEGECYYRTIESTTEFVLGDPVLVPFTLEFKQIVVNSGLLWALTVTGKIYCRTGLSKSNPDGLDWVEVPFKDDHFPQHLGLGGDHTAWVVDSQDLLWVKNEVHIGYPVGSPMWYQVEPVGRLLTDKEYSSPKGVRKLQTAHDKLSNVFNGQPKICLASNEKGSWYSDASGQNLLSSRGDVIAYHWRRYQPSGGPISTFKWAAIHASAWASKQDLIWAVYTTGELFYIRISDGQVVSVHLPEKINPKNKIFSLAPISNMLWIVTENGVLYVLCNAKPERPQGQYCRIYEDFQLDGVKLVQMSCSDNVIWACDKEGHARCRVGPVKEPNQFTLPAWILIDEGYSNKQFSQICVGPSSTMVWGVAVDGSVYVREGVTLDMPIGTQWSVLPGLLVSAIAISSTTVWVVTYSGGIYWRAGVEANNVAGDSWIRIPGYFQTLTTSIDNKLWALDKDGALFHLDTLVISHNPGDTVHAKKKESFSIPEVEEDWEVL